LEAHSSGYLKPLGLQSVSSIDLQRVVNQAGLTC